MEENTNNTKPKTFDELLQQAAMSPEEEQAQEATMLAEIAKLDAEQKKEATDKLPVAEENADPNALPDWVEFPSAFRIPAGKTIAFMRFRAEWTDAPAKGDRWCALWPITDAEQKLAFKRARGDQLRLFSEFAKQTIRLIDGKAPDWTGNHPGAPTVDRFWADIGEKCRVEIQNYYAKTHSLSGAERDDFLKHCFVTRTAVAK